MTTYASYNNLSTATGSIYRRKSSKTSSTSSSINNHNTTTTTTTKHNSTQGKDKWYTFLLPTNDPTLSPGLFYDPVVRRPLFGRAKKGNERTLAEEKKRRRRGVTEY